ncbi:MAG: hypothetical protein AABW73_03410 [Nanoarchaeota archaeon]
MELNTGDVNDNLSLEDKKELFEINKLIKQKTSLGKDKGSRIKMKDRESTPVINDKIIKLRLGKFFLKIVSKTAKDEQSIQNTAYLLTGFSFYEFDEELDGIVDDAASLEMPAAEVEGDQIKLFEKLKIDLQNYIKKLEK